MASNSFGNLFTITTWGESHGPAMGVVIDGCPAGIDLSQQEIQTELDQRRPGSSPYVSPRNEPDQAEILSGIFEGKTTGTPISILIRNKDAVSSDYNELKDILRPGHANYTYLKKYGIFDYRGGGRASARETACRVAAGAVAKKLLAGKNIQITAKLENLDEKALETLQKEGDSIGGVVACTAEGLPAGLGDPIYEKLEARLAYAMLSIPAARGFEIGAGFQAARMKGSEHNDCFFKEEDQIKTKTNHSGGVLGGISTGMPLYFRVPFKPTSSIRISQDTVTTDGELTHLQPKKGRHDPCVAIRAVPVVEAMTALVLTDAYLMNSLSLSSCSLESSSQQLK